MHGERRKRNKNKGEKDKDGGEAKLKKATTFSPRPTLPSLHFLSPHPAQRTPVLAELMLAPRSPPCPALTAVPRTQSLWPLLSVSPSQPVHAQTCVCAHKSLPAADSGISDLCKKRGR